MAMSRKDTIATIFERKSEGSSHSAAGDKDRVRTGAISAMGSSLKELTEGARAAAKFQEQIETGTVLVDLEPDVLSGSFVKDRLPTPVDANFESLVASIREQGQILPILARPHPKEPGRYQIAYGHRRVRAAAILGTKVRAIIKPLTDSELVIAQGKENLERRDLSYIEKAFFARRLEEQNFDRSVIGTALATDKADLSRYISIAQQIPERLVQFIGPAQKVGRSRWQALADLLSNSKAASVVEKVIQDDVFLALDSDGRFALLFDKLSNRQRSSVDLRSWSTPSGRKAAKIEIRPERIVLSFDEAAAPAFGRYLADRLSALYVDFLRNQGEELRTEQSNHEAIAVPRS
jgi:ParB family transcriptional regulator, chromosome partitioning protein